MTQHRFVAVLAALALAVFTGTAVAGGGHGTGGGSDTSGGTSGQQQTQSQSSGQSAKSDHSGAPDGKHESKQSSMSASQPATGGDNSQGVKPSNTTKHDTYAKASSDQTKQYGNGKTAGEIATQAGHGSDTLHGPGNSQPHKTAACPGGHEVDVHALKHGSDRCASGEQPVQRQKPASKPEPKRVDVKKSEQADVVVQKSKSHGVAESAQLHVTICHATGSSSNPYVRISPSAFGVFHGHLGHQDGRDIVPPFTWNGHTYSENWDANGQALFIAGCSAPARAEAQGVHGAEATQQCGTATKAVTERVLIGVNHMIGPKGSGRFVLIHPSEHSAHLTGKHEDDVPVYETATKTTMVPSEGCPAASSLSPSPYVPAQVASSSTSAPGVASASASASASAQAAGIAPAIAAGPATAAASRPAPAGSGAAPAAVGGVKGAVVALHPTKEKPSGGVLGATTRFGGAVASTRLPFTGLPLWIFALAALALVAVGYTLRRPLVGRPHLSADDSKHGTWRFGTCPTSGVGHVPKRQAPAEQRLFRSDTRVSVTAMSYL